MAAKVRCPSCGAKNDAMARRCRVCTVVINMNAPEPGTEPAPAPAPVMEEHFDANVINSQLRPAKSKLGGGGGALSARIAAAGTAGSNSRYAKITEQAPAAPPRSEPVPQYDPLGSMPLAGQDESFTSFDSTPSFESSSPSFESASFDAPSGSGPSNDWSAESLYEKPPSSSAPSPSPAPPADDEKFDMDALFRDMG